MHPMLNIATRAARAAGDLIIRHVDRLDTLSVTSKDLNDFVSEVDQQAEDVIIRTLRKAYPHHSILAEESGAHEGNDFQWVIDPLDGTTNFLHGFPQFAVSIALLHKGRLEQGVVYDPMRQELFTATRGAGAMLNNRRLRVSSRTGLTGALLGTGFPYNNHTHLDAYLAMLKDLIVETAGIRRPGSAALDLAYVAAGRLDGFWEIGLKPWDLAAGALLVQEAGGIVGDLTGGPSFIKNGNIVAGNAKIFAAIIKTIRPHLPAELGGLIDSSSAPSDPT
ncbi:MAG: inositol-1-monophosphatase [Gammaproteobacteria bacterium]|nr:inositol-1-monophosphatase [Gammaproteobacteria bacterium]